MGAIRVILSDELVDRLKAEAAKENIVIEELISRVLGEHAGMPAYDSEAPIPNSAQSHLYAMRKANLRVSQSDISARSREIIEEEMKQHLNRDLDVDHEAH